MVNIQKKKGIYYFRCKDKYIPLGKTEPHLWYPQLFNDKAEHILAKLPNESIDLIITDPPYGIQFKSNWVGNENYDVLYNDKTLDFLSGIGKEFERVLKPDSHCYIFTRWDAYPKMKTYFDNLKINTVIIWDKDEGGTGMGDLADYAPRYEMIMKFSKGRRPINGNRSPNVIKHQGVRFTKEFKMHPTQKPRGLMEFLISKSSNPGDIVADFYGGSYSVPRAAMRTFRKSIGVELNPQIHKSGVELVNKDLHNDPIYNVDWTNVKNIDVKNIEII